MHLAKLAGIDPAEHPNGVKKFVSDQAVALAALLVAYLVIYTRAPDIIEQGRFWAEEGTVYFTDAWRSSLLDYVTSPELGYYSLFNKIASLVAIRFGLEQAAQITVLFALLIQLLTLALVLEGALYDHIGARLAGAAVLVFLPVSEETFLNTINSQFHFAIIGLILLAGAVPRQRFWRLCGNALLLLAGLTGPVTVMLTPLFLLRAWWDRDSGRWIQALLLAACLLVQAGFALSAVQSGLRGVGFEAAPLVATLSVKDLVLPWFGTGIADTVGKLYVEGDMGLGLWALLLPIGVALALLWGVGFGTSAAARWLAAGAIILAVASFVLASVTDRWLLATSFAGGRYAVAPNAALGLALVAVAADAGNRLSRRGLAVALLAMFVSRGAEGYFDLHILSGPDWPAEAAKWRQDPSQPLAIWPLGWHIELAPRAR